jgi:hypothetical protein
MFRITAFAFLLACSTPALAQQATSWVSAQWTPVTEENARQYQQADAQFKVDVEADWQRRVEASQPKEARKGTGQSSVCDQSVLVPGGVDKPLVPRGGVRKPPPPTVTTLQQLLPDALDFAAPATGGLVVQRMSGSVLFGRTDGDDVVVLPLSGETDLPHGMRASIREEGTQLRLVVQLPSGYVVEYRYDEDADAPGRGLSVALSVMGALPGKNVEFKRFYRRAQVSSR